MTIIPFDRRPAPEEDEEPIYIALARSCSGCICLDYCMTEPLDPTEPDFLAKHLAWSEGIEAAAVARGGRPGCEWSV